MPTKRIVVKLPQRPKDKSKRSASKAIENANAKQLYCTCRKEYDGKEFMIECERCKEWFHGKCIGLNENDELLDEKYHCRDCVDQDDDG